MSTFRYVFGTFTNSLTFSGEMSWSNSKKNSTRLLIGELSLRVPNTCELIVSNQIFNEVSVLMRITQNFIFRILLVIHYNHNSVLHRVDYCFCYPSSKTNDLLSNSNNVNEFPSQVFPETVDSLSQLQNGFYRIGTLDRGGKNFLSFIINCLNFESLNLIQDGNVGF